MENSDNIERLIKAFCADKNSSARTTEQLDEKILNAALSAREQSKRTQSAQTQPKIWRITMHSKVTKLATAAVIALAAIIGISQFVGGSVTFADVIKPILNARTVVLDYVIGEGPDALEIHDIVIGSRIRRTISNMDMTTILDSRVRRTLSNMDMTMILDLEDARMLTLVRLGVTKIASYNDIQGTGLEGTRSVLDFVRNVVSEVKDNPDADIQDLGEKEINGQKAVGFYVKGPNVDLTIWANKKTSLPIRIEFAEGKTSTVIKNIEFDVPLEESLVSMEVPAGYTLKDLITLNVEDSSPEDLPLDKAEVDFTKGTEEDFIESLRILAKVLLDGMFPESISTEQYMKQMPLIGEKLAQSGLSKDEAEKLVMTLTRGMFFLQLLEIVDKYHYAGKGVKLGDAEKAIFWYQPEGVEKYRVIYGDLSVKDVALEDLPK
jgi:outer membrane lipoprotein-sorting protein